ncbi:DUF4760 domain-containing protein [Lysinibacillus sphaericus]|uniref:DUF4760 domain-containing protein n=1 Tax=Lysinibacillus sphaericus TaxID=1421 RepID=UPI003D75E6D9
MAEFYEIFKEILLILYYIASIGLLIGVIAAYKQLKLAYEQLKLMKSDIETKNTRASIGKSIDYLNWFATDFIPEIDKYETRLNGKKIITYPLIEKRTFLFNEEVQETSTVNESINNKYESGISNLINQLEFFSAAMMSGLADEELAFNPLAEIFCGFIEFNYDIYCDSRRKRDTVFTHTIQLYEMWKERLESIDLQKQKQKIEEKMSTFDNKRVKIIGNSK